MTAGVRGVNRELKSLRVPVALALPDLSEGLVAFAQRIPHPQRSTHPACEVDPSITALPVAAVSTGRTGKTAPAQAPLPVVPCAGRVRHDGTQRRTVSQGEAGR